MQEKISSKHFTELLAFRRLYTWSPDLWWSQLQLARTSAGDPPEQFIPIKNPHEEEQRLAKAKAAEERMDRDSEE